LPNRAVLHEELERALAGSRRGEVFALLCLDLDRFKPVNDTLGHAAGDELLQQVAARLRDCLREVDILARMGGDEFAVIQRGGRQPEGAARLGQRIIETLSRPFTIEGQVVHIGTSIGVALAPRDGTDTQTLSRHSDLALYRAKAEGRGQTSFFEPAMNARIEARRGIENGLREALRSGHLALHYQPRMALPGGQVLGVEALLRWRHPQRGLLAPAEFLSLAEETGLIVPIGRWVLQQACRDALSWPAPVGVAVNVSAAQFARRAILNDVTEALAESGLPPQRLELEITEACLQKDTDSAHCVLQALRQQGVRIALDNFGAGASSLSQLHKVPLDHLKIDRSLIQSLPERPDLQAIVRGVAVMAQGMGM
jgi:diguanylate cyclase (GGDEF)-like protein